MHHTPVEHISLLDSLEREALLLPLTCVRECGPAAQTLAGLRKVTSRETYVSAQSIAAKSRVPLRTVRRHLITLAEHGWIENAGREKTRSGRARRTNTIRLSRRCSTEWKPYGILPWYVCGPVHRVGTVPWSAKVLLSIVLGRLASLKSGSDVEDDEELEAAIENMGGEDRFAWSLSDLQRITGLTRESIVIAKRWLYRHKLIEWTEGADINGHPTKDRSRRIGCSGSRLSQQVKTRAMSDSLSFLRTRGKPVR
jgi:hypothetical protein